jgi:hypothetical protein
MIIIQIDLLDRTEANHDLRICDLWLRVAKLHSNGCGPRSINLHRQILEHIGIPTSTEV